MTEGNPDGQGSSDRSEKRSSGLKWERRSESGSENRSDRPARRESRTEDERPRRPFKRDDRPERPFRREGRRDDRPSRSDEPKEWIHGTHPIKEAFDAGKEMERLLVQKGNDRVLRELAAIARKRGIPVQEVPQEKLNRVTRKNHQGAIAFLSPITYSTIEEEVMGCFEKGEDPFILLLDGVTDIGNFGAICRTAECAGVTAVVVPNKGRAQINAQAVKSSAGALMNIPVCRQNSLKACVEYLKECGLKIVSCTEKTEDVVFGTNLNGPLAVIMGSEETGISSDLLVLSDAKLQIPMKGKTGSLNVSVATGVMLFQVSSQRDSAKE